MLGRREKSWFSLYVSLYGRMDGSACRGNLWICEEVYTLCCCGCKGDAVDVINICMYVCRESILMLAATIVLLD